MKNHYLTGLATKLTYLDFKLMVHKVHRGELSDNETQFRLIADNPSYFRLFSQHIWWYIKFQLG